MPAGNDPGNGRCDVSKNEVFQPWLKKRAIEDVEAFVPDMAGSARGKVLPADKFGSGEMKMPEAIFGQTVSGVYIEDPNNVEDRDMVLVPDPTTLRMVPWANDPTASVFLDCYRRDRTRVPTSPRGVLRSVLAKFEARGWVPVVAPEVDEGGGRVHRISSGWNGLARRERHESQDGREDASVHDFLRTRISL